MTITVAARALLAPLPAAADPGADSFFIEHGTRRVQLAGCTTNPDGNCVFQQARNVGPRLIGARRLPSKHR